MKIQLLGDRILVEPTPTETKTTSGIIIPENVSGKHLEGTIVATGNGTKQNPISVQKGDTILYGKHTGTKLKLKAEGVNYLMMRESDIIAIL